MRVMAVRSVMVPVLMAKNMAEAWMAWSLKAARNWATSKPKKVRECKWSAGWKAVMKRDPEQKYHSSLAFRWEGENVSIDDGRRMGIPQRLRRKQMAARSESRTTHASVQSNFHRVDPGGVVHRPCRRRADRRQAVGRRYRGRPGHQDRDRQARSRHCQE